ncbi:DNA-directed RNA polymerase subunit N [Ignicoccus islandicus]|uniref:DNA-directed RNA polymerase subunit N n=1 Tax=Ignicoccus islandicus TaxID=54259 RepID=UPI0009466C34|nr:DNA-directed RNA polymerase subunit N [Ignicoccus islandicus]
MIPIRCYTCGRVIIHYYDEFQRRVRNGEDPGKVLDDLKIDRYCCRRTLLATVDTTKDIIKFSKHVYRW